jgi:hypothetical protein
MWFLPHIKLMEGKPPATAAVPDNRREFLRLSNPFFQVAWNVPRERPRRISLRCAIIENYDQNPPQ